MQKNSETQAMLTLTPAELSLLIDSFGSGWLSDGLADDPLSPMDCEGWLEREMTLAESIPTGAVVCRDEHDVTMLVDAYENSTTFAELNFWLPHQVATRTRVAKALHAKLEKLAGRKLELPLELR